jgi:hypothetical protein
MFTDELRSEVWNDMQSRGVRTFAKFLTVSTFAEAARQSGCRIISTPLNLVNLVWLGLACSLDTAKSFAYVLTATLKILADAPHSPTGDSVTALETPCPNNRAARRAAKSRSKHDPRRHMILADRFAREHEATIRWKHFRLLALDGTLINLPRWRALADHFGTAKNGRGGRIPQARLVMLQFPLTRIPYRIALGPKSQAEKTMAEPLLEELRRDDLLLMDRGFWSYRLFCRIAEKQAYFAIREIAQAHLPRLRTLGPKDTLVRCAPKDKKWRRLGLPEAMVLRRVVYQVRGFRPSAVITNVTNPKLISRAEWVGMTTTHEAGRVLDDSIYHHRWEIETSFRELKVVQKMKVLRGRSPGSINYEIASHVLLYLLIRWLMVEAALERGIDPLRLSFTEALGAIDMMLRTMLTASPDRVRHVLLPRLLCRIASHRVPLRAGRHFPRPKDTKVKNLGHGRKQLPSKLIA